MNFEGERKIISLNESKKTLIVAEKIDRNTDIRYLLYKNLAHMYPRLNQNGIRTLHIWITSKDNIDYLVEKVNPKPLDSNFLLDDSLLVENEQNGLRINTFLIAAYNDKGDLIYQKKDFKINFSKLSGEIIEGVMQ